MCVCACVRVRTSKTKKKEKAERGREQKHIQGDQTETTGYFWPWGRVGKAGRVGRGKRGGKEKERKAEGKEQRDGGSESGERRLCRAAGKPPESSAQTNHKIPTEALKPVWGLTRVPSAHSLCVHICVCVCLCHAHIYLCACHMWLKGLSRGGQEADEWCNPWKQSRRHQGGRKEGREERKEELLLLGIQLSRNVLTVVAHTVGECCILEKILRRWYHLFWGAADRKRITKSHIIKGIDCVSHHC